MCGILGIASIQKLKNYNEFDNALRIINHRGPDSSNKWLSKNEKVLLGHNYHKVLLWEHSEYQSFFLRPLLISFEDLNLVVECCQYMKFVQLGLAHGC